MFSFSPQELSLPETVPGGMAAYRQTLAVLGTPGVETSLDFRFAADEEAIGFSGIPFWGHGPQMRLGGIFFWEMDPFFRFHDE